MKSKFSSKRGFTLVELSIVIAIIAIIVAMCGGFLSAFYQSVMGLQNNRAKMTDMTDLKNAVNSWVMKFDSGYYTFESSGADNSRFCAVKKTEGKQKAPDLVHPGSLSFANHVLTVSENDDSADAAVRREFKEIEKVSFAMEGNMLLCRVKFEKLEETHELVFTVFSQTKRDRFASSGKTDIAKITDTVTEWLDEYMGNDLIKAINVKDGALIAYNEIDLIIKSRPLSAFTASLTFDKPNSRLIWKHGMGVKDQSFSLMGVDSLEFTKPGSGEDTKIVCTVVTASGEQKIEFPVTQYGKIVKGSF